MRPEPPLAAAVPTLPVQQRRELGAPPPPLRPSRQDGLSRTLLCSGVSPYLVLADLLAVALTTALTGLPWQPALALAATLVVLLASGRSYRSRLELSLLEDLPTLVWRALAAGTTVLALEALLAPAAPVGRQVLLAAAVLAVVLGVGRGVAYAVVRRARSRGTVQHSTLVLGAGHVGGQVASMLLEHPSYGLRPVGFLDADPRLPEAERPVALLGSPADLAHRIVEFDVRAVVVAFSSMRESEMVDVIRTCDRMQVDIFTVPRLYELHQRGRHSDEVWGLPLVRMRRAAFRSTTWRFKRVMDVAVSGAALLALSPLLALLALLVRLDGGKDVLFRQQRVGLDGRPFDVLKLRSMRPVDEAESQTSWSIVGDSRVTPLGRFLRASSLDELPQLWNVLRGDMTLVGPRPERPHFVEQFAAVYPRYDARHRVPAGVTGWAQVHGLRGDTSIADRARFDNYYIENWSLWYDVKIMLRTVGAVLRRTGS